MSEYPPPTENLPVFDVTVFRDIAPYDDFYLKRQGLATSVASETTFTGLVSFNSLTSPPHSSAVPTNPNDLANKAYVDALAPQTSYIVYLNYTQTFTTSTPTIYKKLNPLTNNTPTLVPFHTVNTTPLLIAGFFNTKADLKFANSIPAGLWNLILYANCSAVNDQNHLGLNFVLYGVTTLGVETIIETSAYSPLINVLAPLIGTYSCVLSVTTAIDITAYDQIGIKVYALSNTSAGRDGSIYFQYPSYYSALQTSFATTQAADITVTNNTWTGTNTFNNTTNLNTTIIQGSGTIQFPDTSVQSTAFKAITSGIYTNSNITVDAQGAISAISNGVGGNTLTTVTMPAGTYYPAWTNSAIGATGLTPYTDGNVYFSQASNRLVVPNLRSFGTFEIDNATPIITTMAASNTSLVLRTAAASTGSLLLKTQDTTRVSILSSGVTEFLNNIKMMSTAQGNRTINNTFYELYDNTAGTAGGIRRGRLYASPSSVYFELDAAMNFAINFGTTVFEMNSTALTCAIPLTISDAISLTGDTGAKRRVSASQFVLSSTTGGAGVGTAIGVIYGNSNDIVYDNDTVSGMHRFYTQSSIGQVTDTLTIGSASVSTVVPVNVVTNITASLPSMTIKQSAQDQTIKFLPFAPAGTGNPIAAGAPSIITCSGTDANKRFALTIDSATTVGIRMSEVAMIMGAGGIAQNPANYLAFDGTSTVFNCSLTPPVITGPASYALPAGGDSSFKIATTAWVQTAIPLGTSALATNLTGGDIGNLLYQTSAGLTARMPNSTANYVLTSGGVGAVPTWQSNIYGNAATASSIYVTPYTGDVVPAYISFSATANGYANLRTTGNTNLNYNIGTGTITGNISGSAGSATTATTASKVVLSNTASGATNYLVMATVASGASVDLITDTSGASYDSTSNTADINITANSGSTTNTAITNDPASATSHAITFVSNTTGNLPQKTRANVGTGEGLTYVPSTNTLNISAAGVGAVVSGTFTLKNASNNLCDITNSSGTLNIHNKLASSSILLQTADAGGLSNTRVNISNTKTEIVNKLQTQSGIIGPGVAITYANNMIGYTNGKTAGNGTVTTVTTGTWLSMTATGFLFPAVGVYMMSVMIYCTKSAAAGNLLYLSAGMSTTDINAAPSGQGSFSVNIIGTSSQPAVVGFLLGQTTMPMVITNTATVYYMMFTASFTGSVYTRSYTNSFYQYTRIA